ncbi:methyltransferase domain-containing protein [Spirosoma aerophilum]
MNGNFSFDTVQQFDNHIDLSIPTYSNLRDAILRLATSFVAADSVVYDLGCSTGLTLSMLAGLVPDSARLIGIDRAQNLLGCSVDPRIELQRVDLTGPQLVLAPASLILSVFTLQFLPMQERAAIVEKAYNALEPGGAFILAEKTYLHDGFAQDLFTFAYYDSKLKNFTPEEILDKQLALRRIMRPQTEPHIQRELSAFSNVYPFWQYLQFKAWLCIK